MRTTGAAQDRHKFAKFGWYARLVTWPIRHKKPAALRRAALLTAAQAATAWGFAAARGPR